MRLTDRTDRTDRVAGARWLRLYPRDWRDRYEVELLAIIETRRLDGRTRLDLLRGALDAHAHPRTPPPIPIVAALVAGIAWIAAGSASALQPAAPDWPGYLLETLPLALVGAVATWRVVTAIGRRSGLEPPRGTDVALVLAIVGHAVWIAALAIAAVGGPYGAITGAAQSLAAIGTIAIGLVRWRVGDHPFAEALLVAGTAMLIPSPVAWPVAGAAWLWVAVAAVVPSLPMRRA
jgi:hypothetical protein